MIEVTAPSNIALIKYMGKQDADLRLPTNPSLSMTLDSLSTTVKLWPHETFQMAYGEQRAHKHYVRIQQDARRLLADYSMACRIPPGCALEVQSTFPASAGIASSASSFAAMTTAFLKYWSQDDAQFLTAWELPQFKERIAQLARLGSGSACRSFFGPFASWDGEHVSSVSTQLELIHCVVLIHTEEKKVSSAEAHTRIHSSPLWHGRPDRARARFDTSLKALMQNDFPTLIHEAWQDFWDMHSLFHTADPWWTYFEPGTIQLLKTLFGCGFLVTLDAGPNIHIIALRQDTEKLQALLHPHKVLWDKPSSGVRFGL